MQLGMVGLGRMGANMVRRLMKDGHECVVYDVNADAVKDLDGEGATGSDSWDDFVAKLDKPQEQAVVAFGEAVFYRRQGPNDFACATCHNDTGRRIRLQGLPFLAQPKEAKEVVGQWPAYRVSTTQVMTMQHRLYDCYWQMRMPELEIGSDVSVVLIAFLTKNAEGGEIATPGLKR
jgi:sulfur-oxidizing protein SoxA